jgi:hypothetical protein
MGYGTVSMITIPDQFAPVNTDGLWFQMNSASYSAPNYKYIVDVYAAPFFQGTVSGTVSLGSFKLPPRPVTGDGIFTPHKILKSQILNSPRVPISATGISVTYNTMVKYWLDYGFESDIQVPYYDFVFFTSGTFSGFGIKFLENTNTDFLVGDYIYVDKTNQKVNLSYNGFQTVTGIYGTAYVTTDVGYSGVNTPDGGDGGYITSVSRITSTTATSSTASTAGNYTWNAIRQYNQKGDNFGTQYVCHSNVNPFLTSYTYSVTIPTYIKPTKLNTYETLGFLLNGTATASSYQVDHLTYYGYSRSGNITTIVEQANATFSSINYIGKFEVGIGTNNITSLFPSMTFAGVDFYKVYIGHGNNAVANVARYIDRTCSPYENVQLTWLNRLGSYEYWNFSLVSKKNLTTMRTEWRKQLDWDYSIGDRQQSILSQKAGFDYTINSDWLNQYDYEFLNELITSPEVYRIDNSDLVTRIPIIITDTKWVQKTQLVDMLFNLTLNYKDAFNFNTQDS